MNVSKGDKVVQVKPIKSFNHIGIEFTVVAINEADKNVIIRYDGDLKSFFPELSLIMNNSMFNQSLSFNISTKLFADDYFNVVHNWTEWRKIKDSWLCDGILTNIVFDKDNPPMYRTNRKYVEFRANGFKARATCYKEDVFNLAHGLSLAMTRWVKKNKERQECKEKKVVSKKSNVDFIELNKDIFDMPCYYHIAHCISTDYNLAGYTAKHFENLCNLKKAYDEVNDIIPYSVGEIFYWGNVFSLVTNLPYKKMTFENLNECVLELAESCLEEKVAYLAIPHFGCHKNNLNWTDVKNMVQIVFMNFYDDEEKNPDNIHIQIVACDNTNNIETKDDVKATQYPLDHYVDYQNPTATYGDLNTSTSIFDDKLYTDGIDNSYPDYKTAHTQIGKDKNNNLDFWIFKKRDF